LLEDEICLESVVAFSDMSLKVLSRSKFLALGLKSWKRRMAVLSIDSDPTAVNASLKQKSAQEADLIKKLGLVSFILVARYVFRMLLVS